LFRSADPGAKSYLYLALRGDRRPERTEGSEDMTQVIVREQEPETDEAKGLPLRTYVIVPRQHVRTWCQRPWSEVLASAERHEDGLCVFRIRKSQLWRPRDAKGAWLPGWDDWNEIAFLRESDRGWSKDKTLLYQQNYGTPSRQYAAHLAKMPFLNK
jgi:hypothetical protein